MSALSNPISPTTVETDLKWLRYAYRYAADNSTDPSTQNGAVIVGYDRNQALMEAANCFPDGISEEDPKRWDRPLKYSYVEHAERNVLYKCAKYGLATNGLILYVPWYACADCARAIIQAGIKEVVGHKAIFDMTMERWKDSITLAHGMLDEAGVIHRVVEGGIGGLELRFDGSVWRP
jgi:dCMP deaminase